MNQETLYHYCSTEAFHSIIENKTIRLSSMSLSNDYQEGRWILNLMNHKISSDPKVYGQEAVAAVKFLERLLEEFPSLGFCMSSKKDLLSQWRGYADDGHGFCIGFSKEGIERLSRTHHDVDFAEVEYVSSEHIERSAEYAEDFIQHLKDTKVLQDRTSEEVIDALYTGNKVGSKNFDAIHSDIQNAAEKAFDAIYRYKNPAFSEEAEWRVLFRMYNKGGKINFNTKRDRIIPCLDMNFSTIELILNEIIIGPRNITPTDFLRIFMNSKGFHEVKLSRSSASYR